MMLFAVFRPFSPRQFADRPDFAALSHAYFAVYDGHNGDGTSEFLASELHRNIFSDPELVSDTNNAITKAFKDTDATVRRDVCIWRRAFILSPPLCHAFSAFRRHARVWRVCACEDFCFFIV